MWTVAERCAEHDEGGETEGVVTDMKTIAKSPGYSNNNIRHT